MFRKSLFWTHLIAGLLAGLVIAALCVTGTILAFEKEWVAWAERDLRASASPALHQRSADLDTLIAAVSAQEPNRAPSSFTLYSAPDEALSVSFGRDALYFVDTTTAEVRGPVQSGMREFMRQMTAWHRWLGFTEEPARGVGKAITGAVNLVFLFLALSGLLLWWPRHPSWRSFKALARLNLHGSGRSRDHNWHLSLGFWTAPLLIALTLTAIPISYRWGHSLVYTLMGEEAPARGGGPGAAGNRLTVSVPTPPAGAEVLGWQALAGGVKAAYPNWSELTFRLSGAGSGAGSGQGRGRGAGAGPRTEAVQVLVRTTEDFPHFATTTVALDPYRGTILDREAYAEQSSGRRLRSWLRYLHTGEALGIGGQAVAGLGSALGLVLVWTGFALSWRRFFGRSETQAKAENAK